MTFPEWSCWCLFAKRKKKRKEKKKFPKEFQWISVICFIRSVFIIPRHTKYVGVYSFRFFRSSVRSFVRTFIRSYVRSFISSFVRSSFRHRVKVFVLKFIRPHILKTLWWISFIFGMMVDIGLKCVKVYKTWYFEDPLMDFIHILHVDRYRSKVFISTIPAPGWPCGQGHGLRIFIKKSGSKFLR